MQARLKRLLQDLGLSKEQADSLGLHWLRRGSATWRRRHEHSGGPGLRVGATVHGVRLLALWLCAAVHARR